MRKGMQVGLCSHKSFSDEEMLGLKIKVEFIMCRGEKYSGKREEHE